MEYLTLKGRGGVSLTLYTPTVGSDRMTAPALLAVGGWSAPRLFRHDNIRYLAPAIKEAGFYLADITLAKVKK